jgi:predicted DNA-binding protein
VGNLFKPEEMLAEMQQMREDNYEMNRQFVELREQYERLQVDYERDKAFYEEALEARMNQLEDFEQQVGSLTGKLES